MEVLEIVSSSAIGVVPLENLLHGLSGWKEAAASSERVFL